MLSSIQTALFTCVHSAHGFPSMCVLTALMPHLSDDSSSNWCKAMSDCASQEHQCSPVRDESTCMLVACVLVLEPCWIPRPERGLSVLCFI